MKNKNMKKKNKKNKKQLLVWKKKKLEAGVGE